MQLTKRSWRAAFAVLFAAVMLPIAAAAVTFTGNLQITQDLSILGSLSKGSGTFVIDHPLDPKNKLLYHSFVESPDALNVYCGVVQLDAKGAATIALPNYFMALNERFRYFVFPIGQAMPNLHITREVAENRFTVGGGAAMGRVSWEVAGVRHDPYILAHPIIVEVPKGPDQIMNKGECLFDPLCH
jgi:hypothetical protein